MTETSPKSAEEGSKTKPKEEFATPFSFLTCPATIAVTVIRIGLLLPQEWLPFDSSSIIGWFLHNKDMAPFWVSTLIRPFETWDHLKEAKSIRHLFGGDTPQFRDAYIGSYVHLPPLVLAALEPILDLFPSETTQSFVVGGMAHLVDLAIALQFLQLGQYVLKELRDPWEDSLQPRVPQSIRPPLAHVFPIGEEEVEYTNELPAKIVQEEENETAEPTEDTNGNSHTQQEEITAVIEEDTEPPTFVWTQLPLLSAQLYYYSPFTALASGLGTTHHSFQNLWVLMLMVALHKGSCPRSSSLIPLVSFHLAIGSYTELQYWVFLIPLSLWIKRRAENSGQDGKRNVAALWLFFGFWFACLQGLTLLLVGGSQYTSVLQSSFGHVFKWKSLHPNFSVLWYLNMELFERYRTYFSVLIGGLPYLLLVPLTIRLHRYPMVLVTMFWMLWTLIRPSSTLVDATIGVCFALLCPRLLSYMRVATSLIPIFALTVPISLYVVTLWMWLETGAGEANFTFFQCLAYCAFVAIIFLEFAGASMRRDKVLRLTEKELKQAAEAKNSMDWVCSEECDKGMRDPLLKEAEKES